MRNTIYVTVLAAMSACAIGDVVVYSGPLAETRAQFNIDSDGLALVEDFESFEVNAEVDNMPGNGARFAAEYADGSPSPLPIVFELANAPSGTKWMGNFLNGRPTGSAWVIRPDNPGDLMPSTSWS